MWSFFPFWRIFYTLESEHDGTTVIYRFNVASEDASVIINSKEAVDSLNLGNSLSTIQRAPNGSLYCTLSRNFFEIKNPDATDVSDVFRDSLILDNNMGNNFMYNLPNIIVERCIDTPTENLANTENDLNISISPNPFDSDLEIMLNNKDAFRFLLYDTTGRLLFLEDLKGAFEYQISIPDDLSKGVYFYEIKSEKYVSTGKLLKE